MKTFLIDEFRNPQGADTPKIKHFTSKTDAQTAYNNSELAPDEWFSTPDIATVSPLDVTGVVAEGNNNAVTSNGVFEAFKDVKWLDEVDSVDVLAEAVSRTSNLAYNQFTNFIVKSPMTNAPNNTSSKFGIFAWGRKNDATFCKVVAIDFEGSGLYVNTKNTTWSGWSVVGKDYDAVIAQIQGSITALQNADITLDGKITDINKGNWLKGKKVNFMGDSITHGTDGAPGGDVVAVPYPEAIASIFGCTVNNYGIGGSVLADCQATWGFPKNPMCNRITGIDTTADMTVIMGGTNDYSYGDDTVIGNVGSTDKVSICGAVYTIVNWIRTNCPTMKIVFVSPLPRDGATEPSASSGHTLRQIANAIEGTCRWLKVDYIDLYNKGPLNFENQSINNTYSGDGLHPNQAGYYVLANTVGGMLNNLTFDVPQPRWPVALVSGNYSSSTNVDNTKWQSYTKIVVYLVAFGVYFEIRAFDVIEGQFQFYLITNDTSYGSIRFLNGNGGRIEINPASTIDLRVYAY